MGSLLRLTSYVSRLTILTGGLLCAVSALRGQEPEYFQEPPAKPKLSLHWDLLARYDRVDHREYHGSIDRGRLEFRPELDFEPLEQLRIAVRGVFDYGTEADEYPEFDNYRSRGAD